LRSAQVLGFAVIQIGHGAGAQALRCLFRIRLVGSGDEQTRTRRPGAAKIGILSERRIERSDRIAAIKADEIKRSVVMRHGGLGGLRGGIGELMRC
jgi:hypothetical protein